MTSEIIVHMRHVRAANLCARGCREWFKRYEMSWTDFLTSGCPASILVATGDPLARRAVEIAREEANGRR